MSARLAPPVPAIESPETADERRRFHRVPLDCRAELLSTALGRVPVTLTDLSQSGCRLRMRARCRPGDRFVLRIGSIGPRAVTVAWREGDTVGVEFAQLLSFTVVTAIALASPADAVRPGT